MQKLMITACICGVEVTKRDNPAVPYTVEELIREAKSAYDAGASIIHLHVRDDEGAPTLDPQRLLAAMKGIAEACPGVILQPSTGMVGGTSLEDRRIPLTLNPEMASLNCGTSNFGGNDLLINTEDTIVALAKGMKSQGIKQELQVLDKGMIDMAIRLSVKGCIPSPIYFTFMMGVNGGISATPRDLMFMADSIPRGSTWSVSGVGLKIFPLAAMAIVLGGHVRVGFEDTVHLQPGVLAKSNGELVEKVVRLARELDRDIATPAEARAILGMRSRYS